MNPRMRQMLLQAMQARRARAAAGPRRPTARAAGGGRFLGPPAHSAIPYGHNPEDTLDQQYDPTAVPGGLDPNAALSNVQSGKTLADVNYIPQSLGGYDEFNNAVPHQLFPLPNPDEPYAQPGDMGDLRSVLLQRLHHAMPAPGGANPRARLMAARARAAPRRPILPQRRPLAQARQAY